MKYKESFYNIVIKRKKDKVLLYNSATSALCWFDTNIYNTFSGKDDLDESDVLPDIIRLGFVVKKDRDEVSWVKYQNKIFSYRNESEFVQFVIAPTMACNYKCIYCFEKNYTCNQIMDDEIADATVEFIKDILIKRKIKKGITIQWFGGEPLIAVKQIERISKKLIKEVENLGLEYHSYIITNGYFLTQDICDKLVDLKITGCQITLDGMKENYNQLKRCPDDAFDKVVDNICYAQYKLGVNIRVNVNKKNVADIKNLIKYLTIDRNIKCKIYIADIREYDDGSSRVMDGCSFENSREDLILYAKKLGVNNLVTQLPKRRFSSCTATTNNHFVIGPNGNIYKCAHLLDRDGFESGNVKTGFEVKQVDLDFMDAKLPSKCYKCKIMPVCMGGCFCDRKYDNININCKERMKNFKFEVLQAMINKQGGE